MIRRVASAIALSGLLTTTALAAPATTQASIESQFDAGVSSADQMAWLKQMASQPNHVGSPHDKANAEFMLAKFKEWGWDAHIETFDVLYPTPIKTLVELTAPEKIVLGGQEPAVAADPDTANLSTALPPYLAYQGDGDVTADVVYVNYGMPDDYKELARRGISVKGKIVIARYGGGWRGLKPKLAQEHGAVGCIIYSDPANDGYATGDPYPKGGARPADGIQRGSVEDMTTFPGDPLTPGVGATKNAKRLTRETSPVILKIPALPMSYADASKILSRLGGPLAPESMRGDLPFAYHLGGDGGVSLHLLVKSDWSLKPIYDVIAMVRGSQYPDRWIIRGNHHDGWVFGAADPLTGNVALMSEAKAIGGLLKTGWRPKRTIVYTSWDGEEPGLLGSTEWAETHADELKKKAVIYLNTDNNERGLLFGQGSHDYQQLFNAVAADVTDPETGVPVKKRTVDMVLASAFDGDGAPPAMLKAAKKGDLALLAAGSGSDYSAFLQHLGIASINMGFTGEGEAGGSYHSAYDSYHHVVHFDDPGLKYGAALSKVVGRMVLRIADAPTPPTHYGDFADTISGYVDDVQKLAEKQRKQDGERDKLLADGTFKVASDPLHPVGPPEAEPDTPYFNFAPLENAAARLTKSAKAYDQAYAARDAGLTPATRTKLNTMLQDIDQLLLDDRGLPGRPWYRNLVTAPGVLTGYGAKTLPGVREAIEDRRFGDVDTYTVRTAKVLDAYADRLDAARRLVEDK
ncbi:transferrin receptor-like dimerization domain-containing protein [Stakelama sediminis]|uniref:N-acetylated-alpha-linked acidic dipeptidase n=1 Tax=Stakelama sediminis TaxID=463200 RepID=A0A840Z183_9SPHN|nr:transferrin receptor-like dimerization domain-containing protein [Stakelama sediminis]MBB5719685.1 N-acetylated-alpha-linked acidic dipeptidase [Stakelama sediminis]